MHTLAASLRPLGAGHFVRNVRGGCAIEVSCFRIPLFAIDLRWCHPYQTLSSWARNSNRSKAIRICDTDSFCNKQKQLVMQTCAFTASLFCVPCRPPKVKTNKIWLERPSWTLPSILSSILVVVASTRSETRGSMAPWEMIPPIVKPAPRRSFPTKVFGEFHAEFCSAKSLKSLASTLCSRPVQSAPCKLTLL